VPTDVFNLVANTLFCLDFNVVSQALLQVLEILLDSDSGSGPLHSAFFEVYFNFLKLFLILFGCLSVMSHFAMTAEDVTDVAIYWCTDDDISYEEEEKHQSGDNVAVPAIVSPRQLSSSSDNEDISNEEVDACTRISHGVLAASSLVYDRNRTKCKYSSSSLVGRNSGHNSFAATTCVPA